MRIGVISDTHIRDENQPLPKQLVKALSGVDLILHAGDIVVMGVLDRLRAIAPVEAVAGNSDAWDVIQALPRTKVVEANGRRIGLVHGSGAPAGLPGRLLREFPDVDAIVFGHSHIAMNARKGGVLLFNPGSATDPRGAPHRTYGVLAVNGKDITGEIFTLPGKSNVPSDKC
ncbi:MAG: metallophosphoesterase family protein [Planctomycetota bacterium]